MPELILIRDPILVHKRLRREAAVGQSVRELLPPGYGPPFFRLIHNGAAVRDTERFLDTFRFGPHDQVIVRPLPRVVSATLLAGAAAGAEVGIGYSIAAAVINFGIMAAVSFGLSALVAALTKMPRKEQDQSEVSAVYGWEGIGNTSRNGTPIPLLYGRHRIGGQLLSCFTRAKSDGKNELYMLLGLCAGPVSAINGVTEDVTDETPADAGDGLKINNNDATVFSDVTVSYRRGDWEQGIVTGFDDVTLQIAQNQEITASAYTYTTTNEVQAVELQLRLPSGLYRMTDRGVVLAYTVRHRVRYKQYGAAAYGDWATISITVETRTEYNYAYRINLPAPCVYQFEIERVTAADSVYTMSTTYLVGVTEITFDDVSYGGIATVALKALATEQLSGGMPTVTSLVHGKKVTVYRPGDDFGEDTAQEFTADGEGLYGWNALNTARVTTADMHDYALRTLSVLQNTTATAWASGTRTGPYFYKEITGNFDVRARCACAGGTTSTVFAGLLLQSPTDLTDWLSIGSRFASSTQYVYGVNTVDSSSTTYIGTGATHTYFRLVRSGSSVSAYSSADGASWTQRGSTQTRADFPTALRVGLMSETPSNTTGTHRANFSGFEFADSTAYSVECSRNPAWTIYDILTDTHYGIGAHVDADEIDLSTFIAFAEYCNELVDNGEGEYQRRHCCDLVLESSAAAWDTVNEIARCARAAVVCQADAVRVVFQDAQSAVQLFTMSNIKRGSFRLSYQSPKTTANAWEIQYLNEAADYDQDYESYVDPDIDAGEPYRAQTTAMYGVTRRAHALREARFLCRANRLLTTMCSFEAGIEAIACEPGDRIEVQFDTPAWGTGGRVVTATSSTITFDQPVTLDAGYTYEVVVRHDTDAIETRTITTSAGTYATVAITPNWTTTPAAGEVFAVGRQNIATRPFIVTSIERTTDLECKLECVEYDAQLYNDALASFGEIKYTTLPDPRTIPDNVSALVVTERAQIEKDGTVKNVIDVTYTLPVGAVEAQVYWRENGQDSWLYVGTTRSVHYVIDSNVAYGETYDVAVATVSAWGLHRAPDMCPSATVTVNGRTSAPSDVTGLQVTRTASELSFRWNAVTDYDLAGYELRYGVSAWDAAQVLASGIRGTTYSTPNFSPGTCYYLIKAYNTSGIYSATAGFVNPTIEGRLAENLVVERDEGTEGWDGTKTDMTVDGVNLDLDSGELTGTYETPELDCGAAVRSLVSCLVTAAQVDLSTTWAAATWTWGSATAQGTTWSGTGTNHLTVTTQFRYGNTSGSLGSYTTFVPGEYDGRYFQFKITVAVDSIEYSATVEQMYTLIDVPDFVVSGNNVAVAGSGTTTITWTDYGPGFNITPKFLAVPNAGSAGDTVEIVSVSSTAATVRYYNSTPTQAAGYVNFVAQGY